MSHTKLTDEVRAVLDPKWIGLPSVQVARRLGLPVDRVRQIRAQHRDLLAEHHAGHGREFPLEIPTD